MTKNGYIIVVQTHTHIHTFGKEKNYAVGWHTDFFSRHSNTQYIRLSNNRLCDFLPLCFVVCAFIFEHTPHTLLLSEKKLRNKRVSMKEEKHIYTEKKYMVYSKKSTTQQIVCTIIRAILHGL